MTATKSRIKDTPIPPAMQDLLKDARGYPIPVIVEFDNDGKPIFTVNNEYKRQKIIQGDLCPISGQPLQRARWFLGGPLSAFHPDGRYIDTPMLYQCMEYALKVCPYLAVPSYNKRIDATSRLPQDGTAIVVDPTMMPDRPPLFVAVQTTRQDFHVARLAGIPIVQYVSPRRPYKQVEFWQHGEKLTHEQGLNILDRDYAEQLAANGLTLKDVIAQLPKER